MFLALTADQTFWKTDGKVLFLGEWCRIYDQREVWSHLDHEVLPYHWDDRERLCRDYRYVGEVYERCLPLLAERLNALHGLTGSPRHWRIVIGPWLYTFIEIVYDRYLSIRAASRSGKVTETWILRADPQAHVPLVFADFSDALSGDFYNLVLYSQIIENLGEIPYEVRDCVEPGSTEWHSGTAARRRPSLLGALVQLSKFAPDRLNRIALIDTSCRLVDQTRLQLALAQLPYINSPHTAVGFHPVNRNVRRQLAFSLGDDRFLSLIADMIPEHMPVAHVEAFTRLRRRALATMPKRPRAILTANAFKHNEAFKVWAADQADKGTRLAGMQHGGGYGSLAYFRDEEHQIAVSDRYFTWGWNGEGSAKLAPMPALRLAPTLGRLKPDPAGGILWVTSTYTRYAIQIHASPMGPDYIRYIGEQERFAQALSAAARALLQIRLYPNDYGWCEANRWRDREPELTVGSAVTPLHREIRRSRLVVVSHNATVFLETLAADFPTVVFWNPAWYELRSEVRSQFAELVRVGVLHETPESAARKVDEVRNAPLDWWRLPELQAVRARFCRRFVRTSRNWRREWRRELRNLARA